MCLSKQIYVLHYTFMQFPAVSLSALAAEQSSSRPATISPARLQEPPREDPEPIKRWKEEQVREGRENSKVQSAPTSLMMN